MSGRGGLGERPSRHHQRKRRGKRSPWGLDSIGEGSAVIVAASPWIVAYKKINVDILVPTESSALLFRIKADREVVVSAETTNEHPFPSITFSTQHKKQSSTTSEANNLMVFYNQSGSFKGGHPRSKNTLRVIYRDQYRTKINVAT
ncbi:hypothetical protein GW17_00054270 [Ensete ventricosum]|nr:hypothetical protein GW17_00054270 [Ensete ventricosum]